MSADHADVFPHRPQVAVPCAAILGEGPVWDHRSATLYWVDIKAGRIWIRREGDEARSVEVREPVGFVRITEDPGRLLLGLKSGLALLDLAEGARPEPLLRPEPERPGNRLNDSDVAPDGTLFFGSMDDSEKEPTGRFYRWGPAGLKAFGVNAIVTNGPAIDPARSLVYTADTVNGHIFRHALGADGAPGEPEPFVSFGAGEGHPDGMTVDAESHLWVCHFAGARITRFDPEGRAVLVVPMPTGQITKLAFGGPDLSTIYVTTASMRIDREIDPLAGHLFVFECGIRGLPAQIWRRPGEGAS